MANTLTSIPAVNSSVFLAAALDAYAQVAQAWPALSVAAAQRKSWSALKDATGMLAELRRVVAQSEGGDNPVRIFWKALPGYTYAGCNVWFARDAGVNDVEKMLGKDDFHPDMAWQRQAAGYRKYDEEIVRSRTPNLDILERQDQPTGTVFVHTSKAPLLDPQGRALGIMGMYQVLDAATGARMMMARGKA